MSDFTSGPDPFDSHRDPDSEYSWNDGEAPNLGAFDSPNYSQRTAEPNIEALTEAFADYCTVRGALEPTKDQLKSGLLGSTTNSFTSTFSSCFVVNEQHSDYGVKEKLNHSGIISHVCRIDEQNQKLLVLAYSLKLESRAFLLPTLIAQPIERSQTPWGTVTMDIVESINPFDYSRGGSPGAAGMIAEVSLSGSDVFMPVANSLRPFLVGPSKILSLQHVADLAEVIAGERKEHKVPFVTHLSASIVVAFALTQITKIEPFIIGLTGVDLSDDETSLTIGVAHINIAGESKKSIFIPEKAINEKAYRFRLDNDHPSVVFPLLLDAKGTCFG